MKDYFLIAKIISISGKNGFVQIRSYSDFSDRFFSLKKVYLDFFGDKKEFTVQKVVQHKNFFTLKFVNFDSEEETAFLVGKEIFVDTENLVKLPEGYHFIHDLIGSEVFRNDVKIGILKDVLELPVNDVYVIEDNTGEELLIPAVSDFIESIDAEKKIIVLTPGDSFYEDDED